MVPINIMVARHAVFYAPLLSSIGAGFLRDAGFNAEYSVMTAQRTVPDALRDGSVQVGQLAVSSSWAWMEQGVANDLFHFAQINQRDGFFIAAREPDPDFQWQKLLGEEVLVDHFPQPLAMFRYACHEMDIDFSKIQAIDAGDVDAIEAAFRTGRGSYVHLQGPAPQQLEKEGVGYIVARVGDAIGPVAFSSLVATQDWLASQDAGMFIEAYRQARRWASEAPAEDVARSLADFFPKIDTDVLAHTVASYQQLGCWLGDLSITREQYERALDVFLYCGGISKRHRYEDVVVSV
jgi:NitT/TauT family transport system substrate-binding protein